MSISTGNDRGGTAGLGAWRVFYRYWVRDHAWVRVLLPNFHRVDADLYRGNHPGHRRLARYKALGIHSVLSLRGDDDTTANLLERDACERLGLELRAVRLRTVHVPPAETLLEMIRLLREMPKPMLVHCKSGADRTGLAVTLYLHVIRGEPLEQARRALSWRYAHLSFGQAGVVHRMLDAYAADRAATGIGFEDWVATRYDPATFNGR